MVNVQDPNDGWPLGNPEVTEMVGMDARMAVLNITWDHQNGHLPDPVPYDMEEEDACRMATEVLQTGGVPGIAADPDADCTGFKVDRFPAVAVNLDADPPVEKALPNRLFVRPKTEYGALIAAPTEQDLEKRAAAAERREARYTAMSDEDIAREKAKYWGDLVRLTDGRADEAAMKAQSHRLLWLEQERRALERAKEG